MPSPRLYVTADLAAGARVDLSAGQANYLFNVLRAKPGALVRLFNGRDGEFSATVAEAGRKSGALAIEEHTRAQTASPDLHLLFAPVKKTRTDFIVEKATELGVAALRPVFTRFTNAERVKAERLQALSVEAAEQSERLDVPEVRDPAPLAAALDAWGDDAGRRLLFLDEAGANADTGWTGEPAPSVVDALAAFKVETGPWAVLIGPEGGFAPDERDRLRQEPFVVRAALGPRILRADTAAVAALVAWQAVLGDWR